MNEKKQHVDRQQRRSLISRFTFLLRWRFWLWVVIAFVAFQILGFIGLLAHDYVLFQIQLDANSPLLTEYQYYRQFSRRVIEFPKDWMDEIPVDESVRKTYEEAESDLAQLEKKRTNYNPPMQWVYTLKNGTLTSHDRNEWETYLNFFKPFCQSIERVIDAVEQELAHTGPGAFIPTMVSGHSLDFAIELAISNAYFASSEGKPGEALKRLYRALFLCITNPKDSAYFTGHTTGYAYTIQELMIDPVGTCYERDTLIAIGQGLERLDPWLYYGVKDRLCEYIIFAELKNLIQQGKPITIAPGKKGNYYLRQINRYNLENNGVLQRMKKSRLDLWYSVCQPYLTEGKLEIGYKDILSMVHSVTFLKPGRNSFIDFYGVITKTHRVIEYRAALGRDILRFTIAKRLYVLDHGGQPKTWSDLVPDYLPDPLQNRETNKPYEWKENDNEPSFHENAP